MLEEAVAEATEKGLAALRRTQAAEELQKRLLRGHEHLVRENERLKQLLDVNRIPYEHVIPQQDAQHVDPNRPVNGIQPRSDLVSRSLASPDTAMDKGSTDPGPYTGVPPNGATSALPLFIDSSPSDVTLNGMSLGSGSSPVSPMDRPNGADTELGGTQSHEYNALSAGHQPILHIGPTSDALTGKPSGPILSELSPAPSVPRASIAHSCLAAPSMPSYHDSSNASADAMYPSSSVNATEALFNTSKDTAGTRSWSEDACAIPDHDQAGAEFILA